MAKKKNKAEYIQILGHVIEVQRIPLEDLHGFYSSEDKLIVINSNYPIESQQQTLFHEILHASLFISGTKFLLDNKQEEAIVRALESALYPIFLDLQQE
jgi:Zn-dependent peptidase ImmA (M78 family)